MLVARDCGRIGIGGFSRAPPDVFGRAVRRANRDLTSYRLERSCQNGDPDDFFEGAGLRQCKLAMVGAVGPTAMSPVSVDSRDHRYLLWMGWTRLSTPSGPTLQQV